jgi:hypothetical protein
MSLLIVIPIWTDNAAQAEKLVDLIHFLSGRKQQGHALICYGHDVHAEMRQRLKISGELAFESVAEFEIKPVDDPALPKAAMINNAFKQIATHINEFYSGAFLWLEPDCVPTNEKWFQSLSEMYANQPRPYMGVQMKAMPKGVAEFFFMHRVGCYPANAATKMFASDGKACVEFLAAHVVGPRMTPVKCIQPLLIHTAADLEKVRQDAILVHGDKQGLLLQKVIDRLTAWEDEPDSVIKALDKEMENQVALQEPPKKRTRRSRLEVLAANGSA